jgi:hypothetical protein
MGVGCLRVVLCSLAVEKSRGLTRETEEAFLLLFKGVNADNCQQAQMPFLYCFGAVTYRPDVKQVQGVVPVDWLGRWGSTGHARRRGKCNAELLRETTEQPSGPRSTQALLQPVC